jgi:hypothetical protein
MNRIYGRIFKIWRSKRLRLFSRLLEPLPTHKLLDVGGYPDTWVAAPPMVGSVDLLNIHPVSWNAAESPEHQIKTLMGNGCALEMPDQSYDIVFSNSVIEHVGNWDDQVAFAREMRRVGRALWIQTPAFECPIEPHYLAPFVHWLPIAVQRRVLRHCSIWGWAAKPTKEQIEEMLHTRLLSKREMRKLFPDCDIYTERLLAVFPKSYVAYRRLS